MKTKKFNKKLVLKRTTIANLSYSEMNKAIVGDHNTEAPTCTTCACPTCTICYYCRFGPCERCDICFACVE